MEDSVRKLEIFNAAEVLFADKGFHGTSIREIAKNANTNIAMISYYFGSKEKLMQSIFETRTKEVKDKLERLLNDKVLTPIEKIYKLIDDYSERITAQQKFYKIMIHEQMLEKNNFISKLLYELKKENSDIINQIISEGQKKKYFKKNIDVLLLMNTLFGTMMQTFINLDYYKFYNNYQQLSDDELQQLMKKNLRIYLKELFKAILMYEQ